MTPANLPEEFQQITADHQFVFACHPGVSCFTECCRELDLALTPYDVLRLKRHLQLSSSKFLEQYVIIEWDEQQLFPICYLTMIDDGRASCIFVPSIRIGLAVVELIPLAEAPPKMMEGLPLNRWY